jgi:GDPmannose 4,6-dehydratase
MAGIYRKGYGLHISAGILFNHESERRPLDFLSQKVAYGAACAALGIADSPDRNERGRPIVEAGVWRWAIWRSPATGATRRTSCVPCG